MQQKRMSFTLLAVGIAIAGCRLGASATPTALAQSPRCTTQNAAAAVTDYPPFDKPTLARLMGLGGVALVAVDLSGEGEPIREALRKSSGNSQLDKTALDVAASARYRPEVHDCEKIPGSYLLEVDFPDGDQTL